MISKVIETEPKKLRDNIRKWLKKRRDDQLAKVNSERELFISILQKRYGYTKEEAAFELDKHYPKARLC